jgi:hypothetical protein
VPGLDRYFGGKPGAAEKARAAAREEHGATRGEAVFQANLAHRRRQYARRGRGTGLQRAVGDG